MPILGFVSAAQNCAAPIRLQYSLYAHEFKYFMPTASRLSECSSVMAQSNSCTDLSMGRKCVFVTSKELVWVLSIEPEQLLEVITAFVGGRDMSAVGPWLGVGKASLCHSCMLNNMLLGKKNVLFHIVVVVVLCYPLCMTMTNTQRSYWNPPGTKLTIRVQPNFLKTMCSHLCNYATLLHMKLMPILTSATIHKYLLLC